ncbi:2238_t:CDS:2 [Acaulospora morrowiae]|uniref:Large ribosomal subunit protein uL3m n=1 Tax=Acaulospora morrowiae TaxID=94023 RepID=A0A9N8VHE8_9GLOM|nr:2238_t:CDS:2 [Acaulospora morrowiae]
MLSNLHLSRLIRSLSTTPTRSLHYSPHFVNSLKYKKYKAPKDPSKLPEVPETFAKYEKLASKESTWTFVTSPTRVNTSIIQRKGSLLSRRHPRLKPKNLPDKWALQLNRKLPWTEKSIRIGVIAKKKGMMALWDEWGVRQPCTVLQLENVQVVQIKENAKFVSPDLVSVQVGCTDKKKNVPRPQLGHFKSAGVPPKWKLMEFHVTPDAVLPVGTEIRAAHFVPGQYVDLQAPTLGKGFAGVMKRWGFKGLPASHGTSLAHRSAGSTGQNQSPGRVFKGKKMAGRMGGKNCTVVNAKVLKIDNVLNLIYVKGPVPGYDDQFVRIRDSVNKKGAACFPSDCIPPPFPTIDPSVEKFMPRELVTKTGGTDPFALKES